MGRRLFFKKAEFDNLSALQRKSGTDGIQFFKIFLDLSEHV
jgi:hypothetical protein